MNKSKKQFREPTDNELLAEFYRRKKERVRVLQSLTRLRDPLFHKQNEVLSDRGNRFKAINCTRRSGKSFSEAIDHMEVCEEFPESRTVYAGLTGDSVAEIIWDVFKTLNRVGGYGCKFNETKHIIFHPNGSRTRLIGLDSSVKEMRKVLGQKLRKFSIDEAGSITQDMKKLCYQMVMPALTDLAPNSWLTILGTCENIPNTFFEKVTNGEERGRKWKVYKWTAYENPHMVKQWTAEIKDILKENPLVKDASWFKTHYLNEWCSDDELIIIKLDKDKRNYADILPQDKKWFYVLGVDLGFNDATAFSVIAYTYKHPEAFVIRTYKESELDFTGVAEHIRNLQRQYPFTKIIVDGANKQGVEEIKNRHHIPLEPAEKSDKATYLRLLRDDVIEARLKVLEFECGELITEWKALQWRDTDKEKEDDRCQNHLSDATLYAWRECRHYMYTPPEKKHDKDSDEFMEELEKKESKQLKKQLEEDEWWNKLKRNQKQLGRKRLRLIKSQEQRFPNILRTQVKPNWSTLGISKVKLVA